MYFYKLLVCAILADQIDPDQAGVVIVKEEPELETVSVRVNLTVDQGASQDSSLPTLHVRAIHVKVIAKTSAICVVQTAEKDKSEIFYVAHLGPEPGLPVPFLLTVQSESSAPSPTFSQEQRPTWKSHTLPVFTEHLLPEV